MTRRSPEVSEGPGTWWWHQRSPEGCGGHFRFSLLCCTCLQPMEESPPPQSGAVMEAEQHMENIQVIVEDLGMDNCGFTLGEEEGQTKQGRLLGRSASSVAARCGPKKRMRRQTSLPVQRKVCGSGTTTEEKEKARVQGAELCNEGTISTFLLPPIINLIPPTPSGIIDKDQFFEMNPEEDDSSRWSGSEDVDATRGVATCNQQSLGKEKGEGEGEEGPREDGDPRDALAEDTIEEHVEASNKDPSTEPGSLEGPDKPKLLCSTFQVPPLPEYPRKSKPRLQVGHMTATPGRNGDSFSERTTLLPGTEQHLSGMNLVKFTEQNLDDLNNKGAGSHKSPRAEFQFIPLSCSMDARPHVQKATACTSSLGNLAPRSYTFPSLSKETVDAEQDLGSPRQRRVTIASFMSQSRDQNGNYSREDRGWRGTKSLARLDTDETCRWFSDIGLHRCIPLIRGAGLQGLHIASISQGVLDLLEVSSVDERELLLSSIYRELHPPDTTMQTVDSLLDTFGCSDVDRFTTALASLSKSRSHPLARHPFRDRGQNVSAQRSSGLVELTMKAPDQTVHLRTPRETTLGKAVDSRPTSLGLQEDRKPYGLKSEDADSQLGELPTSEKKVPELQFCRKEKPPLPAPCDSGKPPPGLPSSVQRKERTCETPLFMDPLQDLVQQVQKLHQSLISFYLEMKSMENRPPMMDLSLTELVKQLGLTQSQQKETVQKVEGLQSQLRALEANKHRRVEMQLLDKMKLDAQLFQEEIRLIHLGRQVAQLQAARQQLQTKENARKRGLTLSDLVSFQCPALLLLVHELPSETGGYSFTARYLEGRGLVVVQAQNSHLQPSDRLLEVNGVSVVDSREEELAALLRPPSSRIVVLRRAPPLPPRDPAHAEAPPLPPRSGASTS